MSRRQTQCRWTAHAIRDPELNEVEPTTGQLSGNVDVNEQSAGFAYAARCITNAFDRGNASRYAEEIA